MTDIIGRIVLQPTIVRPGESIRVEVFDLADEPLAGTDAEVSINGVPGAIQYLQFPTVGQRRLNVRVVAANGDADTQTALLDVQGSPLEFLSFRHQNDIAMIGVSQSPPQPYVAVLTLGSFIDTRAAHLRHAMPSVSPRAGMVFKQDSLVSRLASRGGLARAIQDGAARVARIDTRRLVNVQVAKKALRISARGVPARKPQRVAIGAVYDLSGVDLQRAFAQVTTTVAPQYDWDFGDGETATTRTPTISHDYFSSIDHARGFGQFVVTCRAKHAGISVQRTLTVYSAYTMCKRTGTVVPHVSAELFAHKRFNMLNGLLTVYNVEDQPIILDRVSITPLGDDGDAQELPRPFTNMGSPITIAQKSSSMVSVSVPFVDANPGPGEVMFDTKSFSVVYAGTLGGHPVRCSHVFDVPVAEWAARPQRVNIPQLPPKSRKPWPWEMVEDALGEIIRPLDPLHRGHAALDSKTGTLAVDLGPLDAGRMNAQARSNALRVLSAVYAPVETAVMEMAVMEARSAKLPGKQTVPRRRGIDLDARRIATVPALRGFGQVRHALNGPPMPGFVAEGQVCDPDNLTEDELAAANQGQLVCQLTDEVMNVTMPARWMNARKGDCILSPGGDGIIGGLMLNVQPAQWYSHSGMMTRNYDEVTHSTGSEQRLMDHLVGVMDGSDGFKPSVLKYVWPGAVTQTVQNSIEGEPFPDPEYDATYLISSFGPHQVGVTHNDQMKMIPPLVLKPDPMQETSAVRAALHAIATDARNAGGRPGVKPKYHYRWYCYTNPAIGLGLPEGAEAGWAAGTHPSVCSSFIWMQAKGRNAHLETSQALVTPTDLEPGDVSGGASVRPTTPDGLYNYSAAERKNAAQWLYDTIYNQAYEKAGWFGEILTDGADDVANQFLNAFGNDNADGKDSEDWKSLSDADAVSPDNMLWWDGPARRGLYGYAEPALYREPRIESYTVSKWKKVLSRGTVHGHVYTDGAVVAGALVQAYDGKSTFTAADGSYALKDVPLGSYALKASKVIDGVLYSAQTAITVNAADLTANVTLQPPADRFRVAQIFIDFWGRDDETFGSDEIDDPGPQYLELELGPDKLVNSVHRIYKWGGELRVEYDITVRLLVNNTIDVQVQGTLFEGTSEDTTDLDGQGGLTFQTAVGETKGATLTITNTDEDDPDAGVLSISVKNVRNSN